MPCTAAPGTRISVIIPVFNAARYLKPCLESVLDQTHRDLEVIIVDSGSTDGSLEIVQALQKKDARLRLLPPAERDVSTSRNLGVQAATGDWIGFADSDDLVPSDCYERLLRAAIDADAAIAMGAYHECHLEQFPKFVRPVGAKPFVCHTAKEAQRYFLTHGKYLTHMWTKLFRRDVFEGVSFPVGRIYEDMAVMPMLLDNAKSLVVFNHPIYKYLVHAGSLSTGINIARQMTGLDVRLDYADYIAAHYPDLLPLANDAVLSIGCNMLAKMWHVGYTTVPEQWDRCVDVMRELAPQSALQDLSYRYVAWALKRDPRLLARSVHWLLHMDGML